MKHSYSFDEQETTINMFPAMMNRLRKLAEDYPGDVALREDDGCIFCTLPVSWIRVSPKRKVTMTEEQRQENIARLARYREAKKT